MKQETIIETVHFLKRKVWSVLNIVTFFFLAIDYCKENNTCSTHAQCKSELYSPIYKCICKPGYVGNGTYCEGEALQNKYKRHDRIRLG